MDLEDPEVKDLLVGLYLHWRGLPEYLLFEGENRHTWEKKWGAGLMSKRGNNVYRKRLMRRLSIVDQLEDHTFFKYKDRSKVQKTRALFISLTYDTKLCSRYEAWAGKKVQKVVKRGPRVGEIYYAHEAGCKCVSCFYNRYITSLREAYGPCSVIRAWECYESGYPHVHMVVLFHEHEFPVFFHEGGAWRVQGKHGSTLEAYGGGFTDVEALASLRGGIRYVTKYLSKIHGADHLSGGWSDGSTLSNFMEATTHGDFTLSVMWLFRKRAYSVSGDFIEFTTLLRNSKCPPSILHGQLDLEGQNVWVWSLKGFHTGRLPCVDPKIGVPWSMRLNLMQVREVMASSGYSSREVGQ